MINVANRRLAENITRERKRAGLSQAALAGRAGLLRSALTKIENGTQQPRFEEVERLARALYVPLDRLVAEEGEGNGLREIAFELFLYGVTDLFVQDATLPGAARRPEEIIALALSAVRPEPRVVEALPIVLARNKISAHLAIAFADLHGRRVPRRLAWLADITLTIHRSPGLPGGVVDEDALEAIRTSVRPDKEADDLGVPATGRVPPVWRRWNITYAGTLQAFRFRAEQLSGFPAGGERTRNPGAQKRVTA